MTPLNPAPRTHTKLRTVRPEYLSAGHRGGADKSATTEPTKEFHP